MAADIDDVDDALDCLVAIRPYYQWLVMTADIDDVTMRSIIS